MERHDSDMRIVLLAALAGCVPLSYTYTPSPNKPLAAQPANCSFEVLTSAPPEGYEEVGVLDHYNGKAPRDIDTFRSAVREQVCRTGGNAVIAIPNDKGLLTKGTIIKKL
jgi:hypothetical protein